MKRIAFTALLSLMMVLGHAQSQRIKNVILFIPDGTSVDVLSLARWYSGNKPLSVDEIVCGLVRTYSADSTIADSAPAGTAYATGTKSTTGFVGVDRDSLPNVSILELARLKGKSTGVVVTCEFPHATPADFVCHYPGRSYSSNDILIRQFVYNSPSLVFAGGGYYLNNYLKKSYSLKDTLKSRGFDLVTDMAGFKNVNREKVWALFGDWNHQEKFMSHDIDRNPAAEPSLSEMTQKAISILSKNPKGFLLMVEGSQVDWAAHSNEPFGLVTDFLAFDKAVAVGLKFAKANDSTLVVVCPDHGNGGISIGNVQSGYSPTVPFEKIEYDNLNIAKKVAEPLGAISWTGRKLATKIITDSVYYFIDKTFSLTDTVMARYNLALPSDSVAAIESIVRAAKLSTDSKRDKLEKWLGTRYSEQHFIGWTTTGHTAEDVFLGVYAPAGTAWLTGVVENTDISNYIAGVLDLGNLNTDQDFFYRVSDKTTEFPDYTPIRTGGDLIFEHRSNDPKKRITIPSNTDYYLLGTKRIQSQTLLVNIGRYYYIPKDLVQILRSGN